MEEIYKDKKEEDQKDEEDEYKITMLEATLETSEQAKPVFIPRAIASPIPITRTRFIPRVRFIPEPVSTSDPVSSPEPVSSPNERWCWRFFPSVLGKSPWFDIVKEKTILSQQP